MHRESDKQPEEPTPAFLAREGDDFVEAERLLRQSLALRPDETALQLGLADVMRAQARYAEAESLARRILDRLPEIGAGDSQAALAATNIVGHARLACGSPRDAIQLFERAVALGVRLGPSMNPHLAEAWLGLCEAHDENGDFAGLGAALDRARAAVDKLGTDHRLHVDVRYREAILADLLRSNRSIVLNLEELKRQGIAAVQIEIFQQ